MTTEENKNQNRSCSEQELAAEPSPLCGAGCGCAKPADKGTTKFKIAVCIVILVAVCGILLYKTTSARQNPPPAGNGFTARQSQGGTWPAPNGPAQKGGCGTPLPSIAELNTVAAKADTVFVLIPGKDNAPANKTTSAVIASVEKKLNAKGVKTGIFALQAASPDYPELAAKVTPPGIAVLTKGGSIGYLRGEMSESNLMQAYVASTRKGGCGPGGCATSSGGKAAPCN